MSAVCLLASPEISAAQSTGTGHAVAGSASAEVQERSGGSSVPCAVPLRWRLESIDSRFGLSRAEAVVALRDAFRLWQTELGETLFAVDEAGHPISFEFDERQASAQQLRAEREAATEIARELEVMRVAFDERRALHRGETAAYAEDVAAHGARTRLLNEEITVWNQRNDMPDSVRTRLGDEREVLADQGRTLDRRRERIQEGDEDLAEESRRVNSQIEEFNRAQARLGRVPLDRAEAGRYDEEVTTRDGEVEDVSRQIRVFRYDSTRDLVMVLAHELGHALGLGHASVTGAVMSVVSTFGESEGAPSLHRRDVEMLDATCPGLRATERAQFASL